MRSLHLFAGAGGGLLADIILGHTPICAVEWDAYCCAVLRERAAEGWFPGLQVFEGDVRMFPASDWKGRVDCIHAGFPCQPHSVAGKRKGGADDRNLWPATARVIGAIRPEWCFLENVSGLVSNGFIATVLSDLARLGYDARWTVLGADQVGAPHRRDRWWCVAHADREHGERRGESRQPDSPSGEARSELEGSRGNVADSGRSERWPEVKTRDDQDRDNTGRQEAPGGPGERRENVAHTKGGTRQRPAQGQAGYASLGRKDVANASIEPKLKPEYEMPTSTSGRAARPEFSGRGSSSLSGWWDVEPGVGRVVNGMGSRLDRLKGLGNGQVPLQAAAAWKILTAGL